MVGLHDMEDPMIAQEHALLSIPPITVGDVAVHTEVLRLADGRRLAWSEFGAPTGRVLIHCHGTTSSRLEGLVMHKAALAGVRVIVPDRPGAIRSDHSQAAHSAIGLEISRRSPIILASTASSSPAFQGAGPMPSSVPRTLAIASVPSSPSTRRPKRRAP